MAAPINVNDVFRDTPAWICGAVTFWEWSIGNIQLPANPYPTGTFEAKCWNAGWEDAEDKLKHASKSVN